MVERGLLCADLHCGHEVGLTPPAWDAEKGNERDRELYKVRRYAWDWFANRVKNYEPFSFAIVNGDCIDGKGDKSGATELIEPDMNKQCEMAADVIKSIETGEIFMAYGTPYHTGVSEDFEHQIAVAVGATKIGGCDDLDINGCVINYRHHIGRSTVPHGRATPLLREALWNQLWASRNEYPRANVIVRAHVHYHAYAGDSSQLALTLPALQAYGTKLGTRRMTGTVDFGFAVIEIDKKGEFAWKVDILRFPINVPLTLQKSR